MNASSVLRFESNPYGQKSSPISSFVRSYSASSQGSVTFKTADWRKIDPFGLH